MLNRVHFLTVPEAGSILPEQCRQALSEQLAQGAAALSVPCPPAEGAAAYCFLRAAVDFLLDHPQIQRLDLLCRTEDLPAYEFQWNMWFAERRHN